MKKTLVAICCVVAMVMAIPFASYAREANDTTLFINSDSTDIYSNSVRKVMGKTFDSGLAFSDMSDWVVSGKYSLGDEGISFGSGTVSFVYNEKTFDGKYAVKVAIKNKYETLAKVFFNYQDAKNTYYVSVDGLGGKVVLGTIVNGSTTKLATATVDAFDVPASGQSSDLNLIITSDNGNNLSVDYELDGNKVNIFENVTVTSDKLTSGKAGVGFQYLSSSDSSIFESIAVYSLPSEDVSNVSNTIKGKIVSYKDSGSALLAVAFYDEGTLCDIFTKDISLSEGFNDFSINIQSEKNLVGKEIKYFLFDSLSNIKPLVTVADNSSYREEGFSDELEPYYPMFGTYTKSTDDMYDLISGGTYSVLGNSTDKENADRLAVIDMYRKAGFDLTADMSTSVASKILEKHAPQTYSTLTPKPLMGDYEQAYSIDAPWNNPIPKGNPKTEITTWNDTDNNESIVSFQITTVLPKGATSGNGLGIPVIVADENDGFETFADSYSGSTNPWYNAKGHNIRVPENYSDMLNNITYGDRHAVFIDDVTKTAVHTWHTIPSDYEYGYNWASGLLKDFDARSNAFTSRIDLTGIGNDGHAGVNAAGVPMDAITLKKSDITDANSDITHALGAAFGAMMKARVYPAYDVDSGVFKDTGATGCVPYGGIVQLDPSVDLEGIYAEGKLSLPGYKILKAWRDYGLYNVDRSTGTTTRGHMLVYTSVTEADWVGDELKVPFKNNAQGSAAVTAEIEAFLDGDEYFGLSAPVSCYVTVPVVKYTSYDANGDASVTDADSALITENIGKVITIDNESCDINKDGEITQRDAELVTKYLSAQYPQSPKTYTISGEYISANKIDNVNAGVVNITGIHSTISSGYTKKSYQIREDEYYGVAAIPANGFVFDGWENEELAGVTSNVVTVKATSNAHYAANFKRAPEVEVTLQKNDDGEGTIYLAKGKDNSYAEAAYGTNETIKYGNYQCAFKATPADGYVFESWEVTADGVTKTYHSSILNAYINSDTNIKVNFKKANAYDTFTSLDTNVWTTIKSDSNNTTYAYVPSGSEYLRISNSALWNISEYIIINNNALSNGNTTLRTTIYADTTGRNNGLVVFGCKDTSNYWTVKMNSTTNIVTLTQRKDGKVSTIASFTPSDTDTLSFSSSADVHVKTTLDGKISVYIYQGDNEYIIVEDYETGSAITGYAGLGTANGNGWNFDNFAIIAN